MQNKLIRLFEFSFWLSKCTEASSVVSILPWANVCSHDHTCAFVVDLYWNFIIYIRICRQNWTNTKMKKKKTLKNNIWNIRLEKASDASFSEKFEREKNVSIRNAKMTTHGIEYGRMHTAKERCIIIFFLLLSFHSIWANICPYTFRTISWEISIWFSFFFAIVHTILLLCAM